jgi:hypothetical protein
MYYSDTNYDDLFDDIIDLDVPKTHDPDPKVMAKKEIGDVVTIIDYSAMSDEDGKEIKDELINLNDEFIVIEINQNFKFKAIVIFTQDLVVINRRTKVKYRTPYYYTRLK